MTEGRDSQDRRGRVIVARQGEGRAIPLGDAGVVTMKAEGRTTGGTMSAYEFTSPPRTAGRYCWRLFKGVPASGSSRCRLRAQRDGGRLAPRMA
jgi:hypothetical protein